MRMWLSPVMFLLPAVDYLSPRNGFSLLPTHPLCFSRTFHPFPLVSPLTESLMPCRLPWKTSIRPCLICL